ncbi:uncharacterized protein V2V93DRAFT_372005 [Kockiozyma suomiensis]|uniref:uncharacterized protein n=1 Tax=Kockiozyma suomiensis TaxID=1337062 RepID=UPI00334408E8
MTLISRSYNLRHLILYRGLLHLCAAMKLCPLYSKQIIYHSEVEYDLNQSVQIPFIDFCLSRFFTLCFRVVNGLKKQEMHASTAHELTMQFLTFRLFPALYSYTNQREIFSSDLTTMLFLFK